MKLWKRRLFCRERGEFVEDGRRGKSSSTSVPPCGFQTRNFRNWGVWWAMDCGQLESLETGLYWYSFRWVKGALHASCLKLTSTCSPRYSGFVDTVMPLFCLKSLLYFPLSPSHRYQAPWEKEEKESLRPVWTATSIAGSGPAYQIAAMVVQEDEPNDLFSSHSYSR